MFFDDIVLVREAAEKHGPLRSPVVEAGGLENPTIADYQRTIDAMVANVLPTGGYASPGVVFGAQNARYLRIHRPLEEWAPGYVCEDPGTGGVPISGLTTKYGMHALGTVIALSTLEHVDDPWVAARDLWRATVEGGLLIVSVPFIFPYHPSPEDNWRFTPSGLRHLFAENLWEVLYCDWRLDIPADAGVLEITTWKPQAVKSCALIARAR